MAPKKKNRIRESKTATGLHKGNKTVDTSKDRSHELNWLMVFLALLPFVYSSNLIDTVLANRYTLYALFVLLFLVWFFAVRKRTVINFPAWPFLLKLVFIAGVLYGLWNIVSLSGAINKQQAMYGVARHFLNLVFLFIVIQIAKRNTDQLLAVCTLLSVVAIIHSIIGLGQFYEAAFLNIPGNYPPYGIMANRNVFGSAQVMLLPFAVYSLYRAEKRWRILGIIAITGILISAIISQTRSAWIAAGVMIVLSLVLVLIWSKGERRKWLTGTIAGLAATALLALFLSATDPRDELSSSLKARTGMAVPDSTGALVTAESNISERIRIWNKTVTVIKDNPLTGVGMGNWKVYVPKYGSEGLVWAKGLYVPDSPHNDYLLVTAESGIPGAILYFLGWILVAIAALKVIARTRSTNEKILVILLISSLAGYAADSMFSFPMDRIEHTVYLFLATGMILGIYLKYETTADAAGTIPYPVLGVMIAICLLNLVIGLKKIKFEKHLLLSKNAEASRNYQVAIDEGNKAKNAYVNIAPNGFPVENYVGLSYKALKKYPEALNELDKAIRYTPYNKSLYVNKGTVYTDMGKYDSAIKYYNMALRLTPEFDLIYYNLALNYYRLNDFKNALRALKKADLTGHADLQTLKKQLETMPGIAD